MGFMTSTNNISVKHDTTKQICFKVLLESSGAVFDFGVGASPQPQCAPNCNVGIKNDKAVLRESSGAVA